MKAPKRKWKIHVIQHAHTDVGYTERQEKIELYHVDYIKQAIRISEAIRSGERKDWEGFRWTCESFWPVERFVEQSNEEWLKRFAQSVEAGHIEITGNYLHIVEIMDQSVFKKIIKRSVDFGQSIGTCVKSALTADLNGYGWGYAQALADLGIENLSMCVHPHHGTYPLWRKQIPFWWETPRGNRLLVWNGDHYTLGNELGIVPDAAFSYLIQDEFHTPQIVPNPWELAETRINRYLCNLEQEDYPFDFIPVHVSGVLTDNAPPNPRIMEFINEWNAKHQEEIEIRMSSLAEFFAELREHSEDIPLHRGDWPDWWNDGAFSTPMHTQIFRQAQRTLRLVDKLDPEGKIVNPLTIAKAEQNIMMFSEHTWGHSASISEPWNLLTHALAVRKEAFAAEAHTYAYRALDEVLKEKGEAPLSYNRPLKYKVINPSANVVEDIAQLYVDYWEVSQFAKGLEVRDEITGHLYTHQMHVVSRGTQICVSVRIEPGEEKVLIIHPVQQMKETTTLNYKRGGSDGVIDLKERPGVEDSKTLIVTESSLETPFVKIKWKSQAGIISWFDKKEGKELLRKDTEYSAFTPVYEITRATQAQDMMAVRRNMGRNRKGISVERTAGELVGVKQANKGDLFITVELLYKIPGASHFSLFITGYKDFPRVDIYVRVHKDSVWDPESFYLSLPFTTGNQEEQLWLEKPGFYMRPGIDQLPGTCVDFYCINEGVSFIAEKYGVAIAMPDTPLIQSGPLEHCDRSLNGHGEVNTKNPPLFSWIMTNYWETNFKATLGGFYEFKYSLLWGSELASKEIAIGKCHDINTGVVCFRLN